MKGIRQARVEEEEKKKSNVRNMSHGRNDEDSRQSATLFYSQLTSLTSYLNNQLLSAAI
jgi:hypothetical protein